MAKKTAKKSAKRPAAKKVAKKGTKAPAKKAASKKAAKKPAKKAAKKTAKRTVMYSSAGKKLYAKRDADGKFNDIQQYSRAHAADLRAKSKAEQQAAPAEPALN
ncbi:MAG: hypothetical protein K2Q20_12705 [Phycisphaerales bacterium]|nr:hypothetical protein [Phycisphaerales bacterium]